MRQSINQSINQLYSNVKTNNESINQPVVQLNKLVNYIPFSPTAHLDGKHTIFGRIHRGMKIVERLGKVETGKSDKPLHDVKILKAFPVDEAPEV